MRNDAKRRYRILVGAALLAAAVAGAAELPPEIAVDRLLVRAEWQAQEGEHRDALATLNEVLALVEEHGMAVPDAFWFRHAQAASLAGEHAKAVESATRYVTAVGRDGEHYRAALELLENSERELQALREREALERAERERRQALSEVGLRLGDLSGNFECTFDGKHPIFGDWQRMAVYYSTHVHLSDECRLQIEYRSGSNYRSLERRRVSGYQRQERIVDTVIRHGNVISPHLMLLDEADDHTCESSGWLRLVFGDIEGLEAWHRGNEVVKSERWLDGQLEYSRMDHYFSFPMQPGATYDQEGISNVVTTLNKLCTRR